MKLVVLEVPTGSREFCGESGNYRYAIINGELVVTQLNLTTDLVVFHLLGFTAIARSIRDNPEVIKRLLAAQVTAAGAFNRAGKFTATRSPLLEIGTPAEMHGPILELIRTQAGHLLD
jgi:hypothetical protein